MVHSVSGWTRGMQVKLWDPLRTRAIPERLRGVITTRRYTNPRLPLPYIHVGHTKALYKLTIYFTFTLYHCGIFVKTDENTNESWLIAVKGCRVCPERYFAGQRFVSLLPLHATGTATAKTITTKMKHFAVCTAIFNFRTFYLFYDFFVSLLLRHSHWLMYPECAFVIFLIKIIHTFSIKLVSSIICHLDHFLLSVTTPSLCSLLIVHCKFVYCNSFYLPERQLNCLPKFSRLCRC